tara:strand:- start:3846 stop:5345 length:1500 start_codon:yes stop_codon:yes gene_type:complete
MEIYDSEQSSDDDSIYLFDLDYTELLESIHQNIYDTLSENPLLYTKQNFQNLLVDIIFEIYTVQLEDVKEYIISSYNTNNKTCLNKTGDNIISCNYIDESNFDNMIYNIINKGLDLYYLNTAPPRECGNTYTNGAVNVKKMKEKIAYLESVPQPDQRTDEWYHFRHKYLTASSLWKVFSTAGSQNNLIYSKCSPLDTEKFKRFSLDSPMHWGNKYEPVSILWYEHTYNTRVSDFGCIPHENIEYIAASPDGINTLPTSSRYGRMLEVKNIVNREITGIPKTEYWIQMQIQMEVCKLEECDFLETRFIEYDSVDDFKADGTFTVSKDDKLKGIIMHFADKDNRPIYEYPPLFQTETEFEIWESTMMKKYESMTWIQNLYWKLEEISCVLVLRNSFWFDAVLPELNSFWKIIQKEKESGYEHRAPKRRAKSSSASKQITPLKCSINIEKLLDQCCVTNETNNNKKSKIASIPCNKNITTDKHLKPITFTIDTEIIANTELK